MLSLFNKPPDIFLSKSPAWFSVLQTPGGSKQIKASLFDGQSEVGSLYGFASTNNIARFELSELIDSVVSAEFVIQEIGTGIVQQIVNSIKKDLSVTFSDNDGSEIASAFSVIKGNLTPDIPAFAGYGYNYNTISEYLADNPVLSIKPFDVFVHHPNQPERLYLYVKEAKTIDVAASLYMHRAGTIHENAATFNAPDNSLFVIDTSYSAIAGPHISGSETGCSYYRIRIYTDTHFPISEWYNYHVDFNTQADGCFVFQNSLGGFDTLCPTGGLAIRSQRAQDVSQVVQTPMLKQNANKISNLKTSTLLSRHTGRLPNSYVPFLQQLLFSPKAYWLAYGSQPQEITIADSNINIAEKPGELISAQIPYFFNPRLKAEQYYDQETIPAT